MLSHKEGSKLHDKVAKAYKESIELMHAEGEFNAALLNGARQFLKDNLVIMDSGVGSGRLRCFQTKYRKFLKSRSLGGISMFFFFKW